MKYFCVIMTAICVGAVIWYCQPVADVEPAQAQVIDISKMVPPTEDHDVGDIEALMRPPSEGRDCSKDGRYVSQANLNVIDYGSFTVRRFTNNAGYWHNPREDFASTYVDNTTGQAFIWASYDNQTSTDVMAQGTRYPASMRLFADGRLRVVHKRNTWETDITYKQRGQTYTIPAVIWIDIATGDTICTGSYDCDLFIGGCDQY